MLTAHDAKAKYSDDDKHFSIDELARDALAKRVDATLASFEHPWRREARNCLWYSVILILSASATQTGVTHGLTWYTGVVCLIVIAGATLVPKTVFKFRRVVRPLLAEYRMQKAAAATAKLEDDGGTKKV